MASTDLVFQYPPPTTNDLVFGGEGSGSGPGDALVDVAVTLTRPTLGGSVVLAVGVTVAATLVRPTLQGEVAYFSDTQRPLVGRVATRYQAALPSEAGRSSRYQDATMLQAGRAAHTQDALPLQGSTRARWQDSPRAQRSTVTRFQDGLRLQDELRTRFADAPRLHLRREEGFQDGLHLVRGVVAAFQDGLPRWAASQEHYQDGLGLQAGKTEREGYGLFIEVGKTTRYQEARQPLHGRRPIVVPPEEDPCYIPSGEIVFEALWAPGTDLVFYCENHDGGPGPDPDPATVIVPIRRVYLVENHIALKRVDTDEELEADAFSMSLTDDSWTWAWSASLPGSALPIITPDDGEDLVELTATINGVEYRLSAESYSRDRSFAKARVRVQGRGRAAILDAPYAPVLNHGSSDALTAQQLALASLSLNGAGIGWDVEWGLEDWNVPGNTWALQGTYIAAVLDIARAAGGIVQPHDTDATLRFLPRYPAAPWNWGDVTPDFELPADVVTVEGIEWKSLANYNRIFVSGSNAAGVLGQVTRAGTDGANVAPMVTHPLITNPVAARQRGLSHLANTGRQALVSLRLPVLAETGIIPRNSFIRYVDGGTTRLGLVRGVALSWQRPVMRQTLSIETHVN